MLYRTFLRIVKTASVQAVVQDANPQKKHHHLKPPQSNKKVYKFYHLSAKK